MILYKKTSSNLCLSSLSSPLNVLRDLGSSAKPAASAHQTVLIRAAHLAGAEAFGQGAVEVQARFSVTKAGKKNKTLQDTGHLSRRDTFQQLPLDQHATANTEFSIHLSYL